MTCVAGGQPPPKKTQANSESLIITSLILTLLSVKSDPVTDIFLILISREPT